MASGKMGESASGVGKRRIATKDLPNTNFTRVGDYDGAMPSRKKDGKGKK
jgi:hypothetical protein